MVRLASCSPIALAAVLAFGVLPSAAMAADPETAAPADSTKPTPVLDNDVADDAAAQDDAAPAKADSSTGEWQPLDISQFGQELTSRWIPVPNGSSGAPRQGWLATADGFFTREAHLAYDYVDSDGTDAEEVLARIHYPWSRRFWTGLQIPFYQRLGNRAEFGDITLTTQVMLHESRNVSINAGVGWQLPTGSSRIGGGVFAAQPQVNFWSDVGSGFSIRGRLGYEFANRGGADSFVLNAAIGQTITKHDRTPFGDLTWYAAVNWREFTQGGVSSFVSITPGMRTHLTGNLFLLAGVEFPVTSTANSFNRRYIVQIVKGF